MNNAKAQMSELAHGCANSRHLVFAMLDQSLIQRTDMRIVLDRDDGGHVEQLTQMCWPRFGHARSPFDRRSGLPFDRHQTKVGSQLLGRLESM